MSTIVRIDGLPVAVGTAAAFVRLKAAFEQRFPGITLHVFSGFRSYAEQEKIFRERYRAWAISPYRDYRWWKGIRWGRISGEGTVAVPGTSNHGDGSALDIRDSGADAGVTRYGNARSAWIRDNAHRFGFDADGYRNFNEPWHIRFTGNQWAGEVPAPAETPTSNPNNSEEDEMTEDEKKRLADIERKTNAIYNALVVDGAKPNEWSVPHTNDWIRRQFAEANIPAPNGVKGAKWTLFHSVDWIMRTLITLLKEVRAIRRAQGGTIEATAVSDFTDDDK